MHETTDPRFGQAQNRARLSFFRGSRLTLPKKRHSLTPQFDRIAPLSDLQWLQGSRVPRAPRGYLTGRLFFAMLRRTGAFVVSGRLTLLVVTTENRVFNERHLGCRTKLPSGVVATGRAVRASGIAVRNWRSSPRKKWHDAASKWVYIFNRRGGRNINFGSLFLRERTLS